MSANQSQKSPNDNSEEFLEKLAEVGSEDPEVVNKRVTETMEPESKEKVSIANVAAETQMPEASDEPGSAPEVLENSGNVTADSEKNATPAIEKPTLSSANAVEVENGQEPLPSQQAMEITPEPLKSETLPENDPTIDHAVDDIVAKEGDEVLAAEDEKIAAAFIPQKTGFRQKLRNFFAIWWKNRWARWLTIIVLLIILCLLIGLPVTRYPILNAAGVRSSASLSVFDNTTQQPLKNVQITLAGQTGQTDNEGAVKFAYLKLGPSDLVVEKRAFAPIKNKVVVGWGSNPLGDFKLTSTGIQYSFDIKDFLSDKPIEKAQASSGDASAFSDKNGHIVLSVAQVSDQGLPVTITTDSYRAERLIIAANKKDSTALALVPARKEVFISKRSGKYDVYKVDVDGKNEQLVLSGTGAEQNNLTLVPSPSDDQAALVSTRDNVRNSDGFLLSTLTLLDLKTNAATKLAQSERIQIVGWSGTHLVYVQITAGASAADPKRNRLVSYDFKTGNSSDLASSNYFNDVLLAAGGIYFAPSSAYQTSHASFFEANVDKSTRQVIFNQEVWNAFRTSYDHLALAISGGQEWYDYHVGDASPTKLSAAPANPQNRVYIDSPDGQHSLWVDNRDGKGVLLSYDINKKTDAILLSQSGLKLPVNWISNNAVIFRVNTEQETADYALSLDGGTPKKIRDVTNTTGQDSWYYY